MTNKFSITASVRWLLTVGLFLAYLASLDHFGRSQRHPSRDSALRSTPTIMIVDSQQDVYDILKRRGLRGGALVQFGRFLNMVERYPKKEGATALFPIRTHDIRPSYEQLMEPHSWVFLAGQTGILRRAISVVPDRRQQAELAQGLSSEYGFRTSRDGSLTGYFFDIPLDVVTLDQLRSPGGPVIVTVDAGYFAGRQGPADVARTISRLAAVESIIVVLSRDEPDVTDAMRLEASAVQASLEGKR